MRFVTIEKKKETNVITANVLHLLLPRFFADFALQNSAVLLMGAQKYFLPQSARYPISTPLDIINFSPAASSAPARFEFVFFQ